MSFVFEGSTAVITGAASGIGLQLLLQLVQRGTHVAACDIDAERLQAAVRRARRLKPGLRVSAHVHDVADAQAVARFAQELAEQHGGGAVQLLFNNAGVLGGSSFVTGAREDWERCFNVCWQGTYLCTRAFMPMLLAAERAVIVNTASVNGLWASLGPGTPHSAYATAKFAIRGFTESLQVDLRAHAPHVAAMLVLPGHVKSGMPSPPRSWRRSFGGLFAGYQPVSSRLAAQRILEALSAGEWRLLIGEDAEAVDARVRESPWAAYD